MRLQLSLNQIQSCARMTVFYVSFIICYLFVSLMIMHNSKITVKAPDI